MINVIVSHGLFMWFFLFFVLCLGVYNIFVLLAPYVCLHIFS